MPVLPDDELTLDALLDLFAPEQLAEPAAPVERPFHDSGVQLREWTQDWLRRAAAWGAGPQGSWRAW